ncbi:MAG: SOS response-associated peptidase [Actinomycetales bacterium]
MCGRYAASRRPEDLVEEFEVAERLVEEPLPPDYNVAPTKPVYAVLERAPKEAPRDAEPVRQLRVLTWGLVPSWAKDRSIGNRLINARLETAPEKPAFRKAFAARRCLLPADGYYEWMPVESRAQLTLPMATDVPEGPPRTKSGKPAKQPFFIRPRDGEVMAMAGLYELWRDPAADPEDGSAWLWTCTVLTTEAVDELGVIHDRMPLLVTPDNWDAWLDPRRREAEQVMPLLTPAAPGLLEAYPVSTEVNNVRNNGAELLAPLPVE